MGKGRHTQSTEDLQGSKNTTHGILHMVLESRIHVIIYLSSSTECTTSTVNCTRNYILWMVIMCQCSAIDCNKGTFWLGCCWWEKPCVCGAWGLWEMPALPTQFCRDPKTTLLRRLNNLKGGKNKNKCILIKNVTFNNLIK